MQASTTCLGVIPGTLISAAQPILCWLVSLLPTESLTGLDLKPELIITGLPNRVLTCSSKAAKRVKLATSLALGVLSKFLRSATSEWVSSSKVKLGLRFIFLILLHIHDFLKSTTSKIEGHNQHTPLT